MLTILYYKIKSEYTQQNTSYKKMVRFSLCSGCDWIEAERRGGMWKFGEEEMEDRIFQRAEQMIKNLAGSAHDCYGRDNIQLRRMPLWRQSWAVFLLLPRTVRSEGTSRHYVVQPSCP